MGKVVMLGTVHQYQMRGNEWSSALEKRLDFLRSRFGAQIVMEEWAEKYGQSVADKFAEETGLPWANVGTPDEPIFRTYTGPINYPGHDGTLQPPDWDTPPMDEYGPFENQDAREDQMAKNIQAEMENFETGLFIVGLAHLHSMFSRLRALGFSVTTYVWLRL
jgi:hypothetical protein